MKEEKYSSIKLWKEKMKLNTHGKQKER